MDEAVDGQEGGGGAGLGLADGAAKGGAGADGLENSEFGDCQLPMTKQKPDEFSFDSYVPPTAEFDQKDLREGFPTRDGESPKR